MSANSCRPVKVGGLHDDLDVHILKADLVGRALPGRWHCRCHPPSELHLAAAAVLGEHTIDVHLHLGLVNVCW